MALGVRNQTTIQQLNTTVFDIKALTLEKNIFHGRIEFEKEEINHPKYGKGHLKGSIPLLLPKGDYTEPSPESEEKAFQFLVKWSEENGLEYETTKIRDEKFRLAIAGVARLVKGDINNSIQLSVVVILLISYFIDDLQEETGFFSQFKGKNKNGDDAERTFAMNMSHDIVNGKYKNVKDLPEIDYPMFKPLQLMLYLYYELSQSFHNGRTLFSRYVLHQSIQGFIAFSDEKFVYECSERTYLVLRAMDCGGLPVTDLLGSAQGLHLTDDIRSDVIFVRLRDSYACAQSLVNDLLGVTNELNDENPMNLVLIKVRKLRISLEEATAQVLRLIEDELKDMVICEEKLMDDYPGDNDLIQYIHNLKYSIDGQVYMYRQSTHTARYGLTKLTEIRD